MTGQPMGSDAREPMSEERLAEIEADNLWGGRGPAVDDVQSLVAEVRRLRELRKAGKQFYLDQNQHLADALTRLIIAEAEVAALRPKAAALDALEAWLGETRRPTRLVKFLQEQGFWAWDHTHLIAQAPTLLTLGRALAAQQITNQEVQPDGSNDAGAGNAGSPGAG
jgi:hypothetical protein